MHQECNNLLPNSEPGSKSIKSKHTDKKDGQNTDYPWQPMKYSYFCFHFEWCNGMIYQLVLKVC